MTMRRKSANLSRSCTSSTRMCVTPARQPPLSEVSLRSSTPLVQNMTGVEALPRVSRRIW